MFAVFDWLNLLKHGPLMCDGLASIEDDPNNGR
jgi:hypothetical protein